MEGDRREGVKKILLRVRAACTQLSAHRMALKYVLNYENNHSLQEAEMLLIQKYKHTL